MRRRGGQEDKQGQATDGAQATGDVQPADDDQSVADAQPTDDVQPADEAQPMEDGASGKDDPAGAVDEQQDGADADGAASAQKTIMAAPRLKGGPLKAPSNNADDPVAIEGKGTYASLAAALADAEDGDKIVLTGDTSETGQVTINKKVTLSSDSAHIVTAPSGIVVASGGGLALNDSVTIKSSSSSALQIKSGGIFTGNGGEVITSGAYALYVESGAKVTGISSGTYEGNDCAIFSYGEFGTISGGTFTGKSAGWKMAADTTVQAITGGKFVGTNSDGRGIMMRGTTVDVISGGSFIGGTDNLVDHPNPNGYGVQIGPDSKVNTISGGNFYAGWGVLLATGTSGPLTITGGTFYGENTGLQVQRYAEATITGGTFTGALGLTNFGKMTEVRNIEADARSYGFINYGECGDVVSCTLKAEKGAGLINSGYWEYGSMGNVIDCTVSSNGWATLQNDYEKCTIESIQGGTYSGSKATTICNHGTINDISGDITVTYGGEATDEYALSNAGVIGTIRGGVFDGGKSTALANTLLTDGSDSYGPGSIGSITGGIFRGSVAVKNSQGAKIDRIDIASLGDAVFVGTEGEAIINDGGTIGKVDGAGIYQASTNAIASPDGNVPLEPDLGDNPGNGRYRTGSNTPASQTEGSIILPTGYHMSKMTTSVPDQDGDFHFLVKDGTVIYDGNGHDLTDPSKAAPDFPNRVFTTDAKAADNKTDFEFATGDQAFAGWNTKADGTGDTYEAGDKLAVPEGEELVLYAQWVAKDSKITYDANGGTGTTPDTEGKAGDVVEVAESGFEREGHTFVGWNTELDGSGDAYQPGDDFTLLSDGTTLYAQWEANVYTITFDPNGGEVEGSAEPVSADYEWGTEITVPEAEREGYELLYWKGSEYQPGETYTVTGDHTFVAQWEKSEEPEPEPEPKPEPEPTPKPSPKPTPKPSPKRAIPQTGDPAAEVPLAPLAGAGLGLLLVAAALRRRRD